MEKQQKYPDGFMTISDLIFVNPPTKEDWVKTRDLMIDVAKEVFPGADTYTGDDGSVYVNESITGDAFIQLELHFLEHKSIEFIYTMGDGLSDISGIIELHQPDWKPQPEKFRPTLESKSLDDLYADL